MNETGVWHDTELQVLPPDLPPHKPTATNSTGPEKRLLDK